MQKLAETVLFDNVAINDLSDVTLPEIVEEYGGTAKQEDNALGYVEKKVSLSYKRKPF